MGDEKDKQMKIYTLMMIADIITTVTLEVLAELGTAEMTREDWLAVSPEFTARRKAAMAKIKAH